MNYPVHVKEIEYCLPHRPPLRWVDEVIDVTDASSGGVNCHCRFKVRQTSSLF